MIILPEHLLQVIYKVLYTTEVLSSFYRLYVVGGGRDYTMPFPGGDAFQDPDGRQPGIFHIHVGMAGYGVYEFTGSQTIIGGVIILMDPIEAPEVIGTIPLMQEFFIEKVVGLIHQAYLH